VEVANGLIMAERAPQAEITDALNYWPPSRL